MYMKIVDFVIFGRVKEKRPNWSVLNIKTIGILNFLIFSSKKELYPKRGYNLKQCVLFGVSMRIFTANLIKIPIQDIGLDFKIIIAEHGILKIILIVNWSQGLKQNHMYPSGYYGLIYNGISGVISTQHVI